MHSVQLKLPPVPLIALHTKVEATAAAAHRNMAGCAKLFWSYEQVRHAIQDAGSRLVFFSTAAAAQGSRFGWLLVLFPTSTAACCIVLSLADTLLDLAGCRERRRFQRVSANLDCMHCSWRVRNGLWCVWVHMCA